MKRNRSVEALRCLLMFLIVQLHCYNENTVLSSVAGCWSAWYAYTVWHVDCFVAISGWFGIEFRWSKVLKLVGLFVFYGAVATAYSVFVTGDWHSFMNWCSVCGWFGGTYLMLMFVAPLLNIGCVAAYEKSPRTLLYCWGIFAVGMLLAWFPLFSRIVACRPFGGGPLSILTMIFVYVTARTARLFDLRFTWRKFLAVCLSYQFALCLFGGTVVAYRLYIIHKPVFGANLMWLSTYDAPHVWLMAIAILLFFVQKCRLPQWLESACAFCAPSMFPVYLLHLNCGKGIQDLLLRSPLEYVYNQLNFPPLIAATIGAAFCFSVCLLFDLVRRFMLMPFRSLLARCFTRIDRFLVVE